jgi:chaperonin cofactor prefoldin
MSTRTEVEFLEEENRELRNRIEKLDLLIGYLSNYYARTEERIEVLQKELWPDA